MQSRPQANNEQHADTIRRTLRVLGAQPAHAGDQAATSAAARLVLGRLTRAGVPTRWIEGDMGTPMIVAGNGPIVFTTYIDDSHPLASTHDGSPPVLIDGTVRGPGIERKAGAVALLAVLLTQPELANEMTVIVETDRNAGSHTLEQWIDTEKPDFAAAAWEVSDLPIRVPVAIRSATGNLIVEIKLESTRRRVEPVYGTVLPDLGIGMAGLLSTLKTADDEVHLDGFYDGIGSPGQDDFEALINISPGVGRWLGKVAAQERGLSTTHLTLGMFCAPSIIVRAISMSNAEDYLPESASAIVEFQLLPGQSIDRVLKLVEAHIQDSPFQATVTPLLKRPPVYPDIGLTLPDGMASMPIAPGPSPASIFDLLGIPTVGYGVVGRVPDRDDDGIDIAAIAEGSRFLLSLARVLFERASATR